MSKPEVGIFWALNIIYGWTAAGVATNTQVPHNLFSMGLVGITLLIFAAVGEWSEKRNSFA